MKLSPNKGASLCTMVYDQPALSDAAVFMGEHSWVPGFRYWGLRQGLGFRFRVFAVYISVRSSLQQLETFC